MGNDNSQKINNSGSNRKINNAMRKALSILVISKIITVNRKRTREYDNKKDKVVVVLRKKVGADKLIKEISLSSDKIKKIQDEKNKREGELSDLGYDVNGNIYCGPGYPYPALGKNKVLVMVEKEIGVCDLLKVDSISSQVWLAGTVKEANDIIDNIK